MSKVLVEDTSLIAIADAIRNKNGETTQYKPAEMANAISNISGGEELVVSTITMSGNTSTTIDFSEYVSNYDNIRYIIWSGSGTGYLCIYNHDIYL